MSGTETATQQIDQGAQEVTPPPSAESNPRADYAQHIAELRAEAEAGNAKKQWELGELYAWGGGVTQDQAQALKWWTRAAAQGDPWAHVCLGSAYLYGDGVDASDALAAVFYRVAAKAGDPLAQCCLGDLYREGRGVPQDSRQAEVWYRRAAAQGRGPMGPKR